jgi:hypothetical protein
MQHCGDPTKMQRRVDKITLTGQELDFAITKYGVDFSGTFFSGGKFFLFGAGIGVVLTLVVLQSWGTYLDRSITEAAQPHLITPLKPARWQYSEDAYQKFPRPWFSQSLSSDAKNWKLTPFEASPITLGSLKQVLTPNLSCREIGKVPSST